MSYIIINAACLKLSATVRGIESKSWWW